MSALRRGDNEEVVRIQSQDDLQTYIDTLSGHGRQHEAVIEVDPDDDLTSVRTRLETTTVPRAVLIIPHDAKTLREGLDFRVLRRLGRELGLDIIVISEDINRRGLASENGFRNVFSSLRAYYRSKRYNPNEQEGAPFTAPEEFTPGIGVGKWGFVVALVLVVVLAGTAYLAVPTATVVVYPEAQTMTRDVDVLVEVGGPRVDTTAQRLSGRAIQDRVQVEASININEVQLPSQPESAQALGIQPGRNITLEVRDALRDRLVKLATAQVQDRLRGQLRGNESLPDAAIRTNVTTEKYDHNIGDQAETLSGTLEMVGTGLAFNNDDFNTLVYALWAQDVPKGYKSLGDPALSTPAVVTSEGEHMTIRTRATGELWPDLDVAAISSAARGRTASEAQKSIAKMGQFARDPEIDMWPGWASRAFRIQVKTVVQTPPPSQVQR